MYYLVANWKSNKTHDDVINWFDEFDGATSFSVNSGVQTIICPPANHLSTCAERIRDLGATIKIGMQDISCYEMGAYTGEIAAAMVADQIDYVIVGHSERRRYFGETSSMVSMKVDQAIGSGITPIVCVDTPYLEEQLAAINQRLLTQCIFAYEPVSAIGTGEPDTPGHAAQIASQIKTMAGEVIVLYGGSVNEDNLGYYLNQKELAGALVGGASLSARKMKGLIAVAAGLY